MKDKKELRQVVRALKSKLDDTQKRQEALAVFQSIETLQAFRSAKHILLYYSLPDELPTHEIVDKWSHVKTIYLPRVNGDELDLLKYDRQHMGKGAMGITEPTGDELVDPSIIDLVIVPAVALDKHCNRCGRGRGYYDRLLPLCTHARYIAVGLDCQFFDNIPVAPHDIKMDGVVTASHLAFAKPRF